MNLFLDTRQLTQAREDHLTCFIAAALEVDADFRRAYESLVLARLASDGQAPTITAIETQTHFAEHRSVPDMVLTLADGRRVLCEHKLDAPETMQVTRDGRTVKQLERYLAIPGIAGLAYFRSAPVMVPDDVLANQFYLRPESAAHFVWHDLYAALERGESDVVRWLVSGFERLGFTPPEPHVGELWPGDTEEVRENQRNFGKLWQKTRRHLETDWTVHQDQRGCELYANPKHGALATQVYVSPIAQGGSLLRTRIDTDAESLDAAQRRIDAVTGTLPAEPETSVIKKPGGRVFIDLLAPLRIILADADTVSLQEERLYAQVVPLVDALTLGGHKSGRSESEPVTRSALVESAPPVPHVGRLWPGTTEEVRENQRNFGKLWQKTRQHFETAWAIHQDQRGCELYFKPKGKAYAQKIYVSPIANGGTELRTRIDVPGGDKEQLKQRFEALAARLPVPSRVKITTQRGRTFVDLLAPLDEILRDAETPTLQAERLHNQVAPIIEAVSGSD